MWKIAAINPIMQQIAATVTDFVVE